MTTTWVLWSLATAILAVLAACLWLTIATLLDARRARRVQDSINRQGR